LLVTPHPVAGPAYTELIAETFSLALSPRQALAFLQYSKLGH
jgi:hypothetical protein